MIQSTSEILREMVAEQLGVDIEQVVPTAKFIADLGADSLDVVELVMNVEERFGLQIDDGMAGRMETVQDVLDYLDSPPNENRSYTQFE